MRGSLALVSLLLLLLSCGEGDDDAETIDATAACDRLGDLGDEILELEDARSRTVVREQIEPVAAAFVEAADDSGDDRLAELAATCVERFKCLHRR